MVFGIRHGLAQSDPIKRRQAFNLLYSLAFRPLLFVDYISSAAKNITYLPLVLKTNLMKGQMPISILLKLFFKENYIFILAPCLLNCQFFLSKRTLNIWQYYFRHYLLEKIALSLASNLSKSLLHNMN